MCKTTADRLEKAVSSITVFVVKTLPIALEHDLVLHSFFPVIVYVYVYAYACVDVYVYVHVYVYVYVLYSTNFCRGEI